MYIGPQSNMREFFDNGRTVRRQPEDETVFFYGQNDNVGRKNQNGIAVEFYRKRAQLQLRMGTDYNNIRTRTSRWALGNDRRVGRWATVMFVYDGGARSSGSSRRARRQFTQNWPVRVFVDGVENERGSNIGSNNYGMSGDIVDAPYATIGMAGRSKVWEDEDGNENWRMRHGAAGSFRPSHDNDSRRPWHRHMRCTPIIRFMS